MAFRHQLAAIFYLTWFVFALGCDNEEVATYDVKLHLMWSKERLPRDPDNPYNGKPHWSPVFGQSHNRTYVLYRVGDVPRAAVQRLLQFGNIDDLMLEGEEEPKVYDQFSSPAVSSGIGETNGLVVVDGGHSLVSLISRMMPSQNWFVGVDGVDLCIDSSWVEQITLDLEPLVYGTPDVNSFEDDYHSSKPTGIVSKLGAKSFDGHSYPNKEQMTIAKVEFTKKEVYSSEEIKNLVRNDVIRKLKRNNFIKENPKPVNEEYFPELTTKNYVNHLIELEEDPVGTPRSNQPENNIIVVTNAPSFRHSTDEENSGDLLSMDDAVLAVARGKKLGLKKHLPRHFRSRLHHAVNYRPHRR